MKVFGFAGWSGSGKTTLIEQIIPRLVAQGVTVSLVKHAHRSFEIDQPGKDSWRHREAGCTEVMLTSPARWAIMHELGGAPELSLQQALARLSSCDIALVEGFRRGAHPKLEIWRQVIGKPVLFTSDPNIVAVATDDAGALPAAGLAGRPVLPLDDVGTIATLVLDHAAAYPS